MMCERCRVYLAIRQLVEEKPVVLNRFERVMGWLLLKTIFRGISL